MMRLIASALGTCAEIFVHFCGLSGDLVVGARVSRHSQGQLVFIHAAYSFPQLPRSLHAWHSECGSLHLGLFVPISDAVLGAAVGNLVGLGVGQAQGQFVFIHPAYSLAQLPAAFHD
jgi:hypothetical protein